MHKEKVMISMKKVKNRSSESWRKRETENTEKIKKPKKVRDDNETQKVAKYWVAAE